MSGREKYLAEADQRVEDAEAHVANVRARVANLEREGRDASAARQVLETLEGTLELMRRNRDVIERLLDNRDRRNGASRPE